DGQPGDPGRGGGGTRRLPKLWRPVAGGIRWTGGGSRGAHGAGGRTLSRQRRREIRVAQTEAERALVWKGRKAAFASMGRISPNYIVQDGVIPRTALPQVMGEIARLSRENGLRVAHVFHAGDGNLHPLVLYDRRT